MEKHQKRDIMTSINQRIDITKDVRENLILKFNVSERTVFKAIAYDSDSLKAKQIRAEAMRQGGVIMTTSPLMQTIHDSNGYLRQYYPTGALIEMNKMTGTIEVYNNGHKIWKKKDATISDWTTAQELAEQIEGESLNMD